MMEKFIMGKYTKKEKKKAIVEMKHLIENLRMCDNRANCRRCSHKHECLKHTRNVLSWILETFVVSVDMSDKKIDHLIGESYI